MYVCIYRRGLNDLLASTNTISPCTRSALPTRINRDPQVYNRCARQYVRMYVCLLSCNPEKL